MTYAKLPFSTIVAMTPEQMAQASVFTQNACSYILGKIDSVKDDKIRAELAMRYQSVELRFLALYADDLSKERLRRQLVNGGFLDSSVSAAQLIPERENIAPVWVASGSGYRGHHAHPGGLAVHIEENLRLTLSLADMYKQMYDLNSDEDMLIYTHLTHDCAKAWLANWCEDASVLPQFELAGTGAHHIFGLAESICCGVSPQYLYCQASAHLASTSKQSREVIIDFLRAAFIIAQKDICEYGLLTGEGKLTFDFRREEFWFVNLGDQMLFTVTELRSCVKALQELAQARYGFSEAELAGKPFHQLRNYLFSQLSVAKIFSLLRREGMKGLREQVDEMVVFNCIDK